MDTLSGEVLSTIASSSAYGSRESPPREQVHYMRSSCSNPWSTSPSRWEHPHMVARAPTKFGWGQNGKRPVNTRNYWSPSHWVRSIEESEASPMSTYLDYSFTEDFNRIWKDSIKRERRSQRASSENRRKRAASATVPTSQGSQRASSSAESASFSPGTEYSSTYSKEGYGHSLEESARLGLLKGPMAPRPKNFEQSVRLGDVMGFGSPAKLQLNTPFATEADDVISGVTASRRLTMNRSAPAFSSSFRTLRGQASQGWRP